MALRLDNPNLGTPSGLAYAVQSVFRSSADVFGYGYAESQSAAVVGQGTREAVDLGTPPDLLSGDAVVVGAGTVSGIGVGYLSAQPATLVGNGIVKKIRVGVGTLQAQAASVAGVGEYGFGGSGVLESQRATVAGEGYNLGTVLGNGPLFAQPAQVVAVGMRTIKGAGALNAGEASVFGVTDLVAFNVAYNCWLPPNSLGLEVLSMKNNYAEPYVGNKRVPVFTTVGWDDIVTHHEGINDPMVDEYRFSRDKVFKKDEDDGY